MSLVCPKCNTTNVDEAKFCKNCGGDVEELLKANNEQSADNTEQNSNHEQEEDLNENAVEQFQSKEYEYACFWIRTAAIILDGILIMAITLPLSLMIYGSDAIGNNDGSVLGVADFVINYLLSPFITIVFWVYKSATPGKMMLQLKILDADTGNQLSWGQSIGRYLFLSISILSVLGILWILWDKRRQGWHDKLAKTIVVTCIPETRNES